jgi:glyoxylase I family protein
MVCTCIARTLLFASVLGCTIVSTSCNSTGQAQGTRMGRRGDSGVRLEHVALNVTDPAKMAQWYVDNLGMKVLREGPPPVNMRFIADSGGNMMLELYHNPPDAVPNYASMDPLLLHVAFMVEDVEAVRQKLIAAGATPVGEITVTPAGDKLAMLRDPWGLAIQFVHRAEPMMPQTSAR